MRLNLGCGLDKRPGWVNVDLYGDPDVHVNLAFPAWPFADDSAEEIEARHVIEHLPDFWLFMRECARILKPGGRLTVTCPDESNSTALTYRDHYRVFSVESFHGCLGMEAGANAWAEKERDTLPLELVAYNRAVFPEYEWMMRWPFKGILCWCSRHLRNFVKEQVFTFQKPVREAR